MVNSPLKFPKKSTQSIVKSEWLLIKVESHIMQSRWDGFCVIFIQDERWILARVIFIWKLHFREHCMILQWHDIYRYFCHAHYHNDINQISFAYGECTLCWVGNTYFISKMKSIQSAKISHGRKIPTKTAIHSIITSIMSSNSERCFDVMLHYYFVICELRCPAWLRVMN